MVNNSEGLSPDENFVPSKTEEGVLVQKLNTRISKSRPEERASIVRGKEEKKVLRRLGLLEKKAKKKPVKKKRKGLNPLQKFSKRIGQGVDEEKFLRKQLRLKRLRKQLQPQRKIYSSTNRHEQGLLRMGQEAERYEKMLEDGEVAEDYFVRKLQIRKRKIQLQREFARRNNLLASNRFQKPQNDVNFLSVQPENNILKSENIMREKENSINILKPRNSILNTKNSGNNLRFF